MGYAFGTFYNPKKMDGNCGFSEDRETKLTDMIFFKNVNNPYPPKKPSDA